MKSFVLFITNITCFVLSIKNTHIQHAFLYCVVRSTLLSTSAFSLFRPIVFHM